MEQAHENKMTRDETLKVALMVGKILLKSGAETYRVEDTINRFCIANGYEVDIFVTPTVIILGNEQVDSFNCVSRIRYRTTNLGMISEMNDMSYKFERWPMSYRGTMAWLEEKLKAQVSANTETLAVHDGAIGDMGAVMSAMADQEGVTS